MKKFSFYTLLAAAAIAFAACTDDYKDWADPQGYNQAEASSVSFVAANVGSIDLRDASVTEFPIFNPTVTTNAEGATTTYVATIYNADKSDSRNVSCAENGVAQRSDVQGAMSTLYGAEEVERQAPMDVTAYTVIDGTAVVSKVEGLTLTATPKYVEKPKIWYVLGNYIGAGTWFNKKTALGDAKFRSLVPMFPNPENLEELVYAGFFPKNTQFCIIIYPYNDYPRITGGDEKGGQQLLLEANSDVQNITVGTEGYYKVTVNVADKSNPTLKMTQITCNTVCATMSMPGSYQSPAWSVTSNKMTKVTTKAEGENHDWVADVTFTDNPTDAATEGIKFAADGAWDVNWGGSMFPMGSAVRSGNNILYKEGTYKVIFNDLLGIYYFLDMNNQDWDEGAKPSN